MEQSLSWEANRFSASQEIPGILWKPKVHYRVNKSSAPVPILSQIIPVHAPHPTSWISIVIFSFHLSLGLPSRSLDLISTQNPYIHLSSPPYPLHAQPLSVFSIWSSE